MNNNTIFAGIIVGGVAISAAGAIAYSSGYNPLQKYATVVAVTQAYDTTQTPRIVCGDDATLAAAQAAAATTWQAGAGTDLQPSPTPAPAPPREEQSVAAKSGEEGAPRCLTVYDTASVEAGFDVTYELDGVQKVVRLEREPGRRIPVEDGELVVSQS